MSVEFRTGLFTSENRDKLELCVTTEELIRVRV